MATTMYAAKIATVMRVNVATQSSDRAKIAILRLRPNLAPPCTVTGGATKRAIAPSPPQVAGTDVKPKASSATAGPPLDSVLWRALTTAQRVTIRVCARNLRSVATSRKMDGVMETSANGAATVCCSSKTAVRRIKRVVAASRPELMSVLAKK